MLNENISMSLISLQPGESMAVYCVRSHMIVSAFCFVRWAAKFIVVNRLSKYSLLSFMRLISSVLIIR